MNKESFEKELVCQKLPYQLGLLRGAVNYQKWVAQVVMPFLGQRILEIGAGIGNMSRWLPVREKLILSEIDPELLSYLEQTSNVYFNQNDKVKVVHVDLESDWVKKLAQEDVDTIVSFNVMEHVLDDEKFFSDLLSILRQSKSSNLKRLITFIPAHRFAYGSFDKGYGHYRRYSRSDLLKLKNKYAPDADFFCRYFNAVGLPGWVIYGKVFKRPELDEKSILCFEKICPWVKSFDDFLHVKMRLSLGQSILSVVSFK